MKQQAKPSSQVFLHDDECSVASKERTLSFGFRVITFIHCGNYNFAMRRLRIATDWPHGKPFVNASHNVFASTTFLLVVLHADAEICAPRQRMTVEIDIKN